MNALKLMTLVAIILIVSCNNDENGIINEGNDPNFKIVANNDGELKKFNRKVVVFGIDIYAVSDVTDENLLHAANLMAQYLDNDEDGTPDNQVVVDKMVENKAFVVMWNKQRDLLGSFPSSRTGQDLGNDETQPSFVSNGKTGTFDAALEEILHIITHAGYSQVYPDIFGESQGSEIANAMDIARGGQYTSIPNSYPADAWYTYDDRTCEYDCQVTEYFYWSLTSILGAQENRLSEIEHEWKLNTKDKVQTDDVAVYQLLTNPQYNFPTVLPDGSYRQ